MENEGQTESALACTDAQPILKHVRPIRANYVPRKYKSFEGDENSADLCACSNANPSITIESTSEPRRKSEHETGESDDKLLTNTKSPYLKRKAATANIHINVEPVVSLSPKRISQKNIINGKQSPEISVGTEKAIDFSTNENDSFTSINDAQKTNIVAGDIDDLTKRRPGRPRGSSKRGSSKKRRRSGRRHNDTSDLSNIKRACRTKPPEGFFSLTATSSSSSPRKQIKLTQTQVDASENVDNKGPSSDAATSDTTVNKNADTAYQCSIKTKLFNCNVCEKNFKTFNRFVQHQRSHGKADKTVMKNPQSGENENANTTRETENEKKHKCGSCSRTFSYLGSLQTHLKTHKCSCNVCSKEFVSFRRLQLHLKSYHQGTGLNKGEARIQGSTSHGNKKSNSLQSHEQVAHNLSKTSRAPKPVRVSRLDKQSNKCNHNRQDVINNETQEYRCDICNKTFTLEKTLAKHKESHHQNKPKPCLTSNPPKSEKVQESEETPHKCDKCDRAFRSLHGLHRHAALHRDLHPLPQQTPPKRQSSRLKVSRSPTKPHNPSPPHQSSKHTTCSQSISHKSETNTHDEKAHEMKKETSPQPEAASQQWIKFSRENGQIVYRCALCTNSDRKFSLVASVRKHVGMVHKEFTDNLVEPAGLYDNLPAEPSTGSNNGPSTSTPSSSTQVSGESSSTPESSDSQKTCTCIGRGKAFVFKNNKLTHLPSNCPVHSKESSESKKIIKGTQILKCKHCDEEFDGLSREKFQEHELSHELKATEPMGMAYACFECEVEFAMANELMDHYEKEH